MYLLSSKFSHSIKNPLLDRTQNSHPVPSSSSPYFPLSSSSFQPQSQFFSEDPGTWKNLNLSPFTPFIFAFQHPKKKPHAYFFSFSRSLSRTMSHFNNLGSTPGFIWVLPKLPLQLVDGHHHHHPCFHPCSRPNALDVAPNDVVLFSTHKTIF